MKLTELEASNPAPDKVTVNGWLAPEMLGTKELSITAAEDAVRV